MEQLAALGTSIASNRTRTYEIYLPCLEANAATIFTTEWKTFKYGAHPRQALDVYYPPDKDYSSKPILLFCYGGGLVIGDKQLHQTKGLVYSNLGHFFATEVGMQTVIPDYRLVGTHEDAVYPSGGEDVALAIDWIRRELVKESHREIFLMGNSAGGVHVATFLLDDAFKPRRELLKPNGTGLSLKGAILLSAPTDFIDTIPRRVEILRKYYDGNIEERCPHGLLEKVKSNGEVPVPGANILLVYTALDPDEVIIPNKRFVEAWPDSGQLEVLEVPGHNHISPFLSLGTGDEREEEWGRQVVAWIEKNSGVKSSFENSRVSRND